MTAPPAKPFLILLSNLVTTFVLTAAATADPLMADTPAQLTAEETSTKIPTITESAPAEPAEDLIIDPQSIIQLVYGTNPEVTAARYAREVAEYQFKDFQRNLSQFTPFVLRTSIERDERDPWEDQEYSTSVGMQKEFFDGTSIFGGVGHRGGFGDDETSQSQFLETDVTLPLAGSNTTLRRITDRSREENEMYNSRLEYIDTIRDNIQQAQLQYFWLLVDFDRKANMATAIEDYENLLKSPRIRENAADKTHLASEIQSLRQQMMNINERVNTGLLDVRLAIGLDSLQLSQIHRVDLHAEDFYGKRYLSRDKDQLLAQADRNDIRIQVLQNARTNAVEKRNLADRGKWDIFVDLAGQLDVNGEGGLRDENGYEMTVGLRIQRIDAKLLAYSRSRAVAEINKYDAMINHQKLKTRNRIDREFTIAQSRRKQCDQLIATIAAREKIHQQKLNAYLAGQETIENLITAANNLRWTKTDLSWSLGELYEAIIWLDHASGVAFQTLGIQIHDGF